MHIGFTGTRHGMAKIQKQVLDRELLNIMHIFAEQTWYFHHGDCVGADAEAHEIAISCGASIMIHPPVKETLRAFCKPYTRMYEPKHYLVRNFDIVAACDKIYACPKGPESMRSGTWSTIRYAKKQNKPLVIITPDGNMVEHGGA